MSLISESEEYGSEEYGSEESDSEKSKRQAVSITRQYPHRQRKIKNLFRHDKSTFDKCKEATENEELKRNYIKWKSGINHKTNRRIKIEGKIHDLLKADFKYVILSDELKDIHMDDYLTETERIKKDINEKNIIIKESNALISDIIIKINELEKWEDYIVLENKKYGIPCIYDNIHRENDCFGKIVKNKICIHECRECRGSASFPEPCRCKYRDIYDCERCGHVYEK
jgi:hypothetical protein